MTFYSSAGKIETQGSIFSNETRTSEATCVLRYYIKKSFPPTLIRTLIITRKKGKGLL